MLKHWDSHAKYKHFISEAVALLNPLQFKKTYSGSDSWNKLASMKSALASRKVSRCFFPAAMQSAYLRLFMSFLYIFLTFPENVRTIIRRFHAYCPVYIP